MVLRLVMILLMLQSTAIYAEPIGISLPDTNAVIGANIGMPVYVDSSLNDASVYAYQLQIAFDASLLHATSVSVTGYLGQSFGMPTLNLAIPGQITLAAAGTNHLEGSGVLLMIHFETIQNGTSLVSFTDMESNFFNEGSPALILNDGSISISPIDDVHNPERIPQSIFLNQNFPNPFNPSTTLRYRLPEEASVSLIIYDIRGNTIRTYTSETKAAGWHEKVWNGIDESGQPVSPGLYFTRLQVADPTTAAIGGVPGGAGSCCQTIKMVCLQ